MARGSLGRALSGTHRQDLPGCKAVSEARVLVINTGGTIGMVQDDKGERGEPGCSRGEQRSAGGGQEKGRRPLLAPAKSPSSSGRAAPKRDPFSSNPACVPVGAHPCEQRPLGWERQGTEQRVSCSASPFSPRSRAENETSFVPQLTLRIF